MRALGVLGGMSWASTALYYRGLNEGIAQRCGGLSSAPLWMHSVDFAPVAAAQAAGRWDALAAQLSTAARHLASAGAQGLLLATNTMHRVAAAVETAAGVPLLHIADATGAAVHAAGHVRVGLLGTRFTMETPTVVGERLRDRHGLQVVVPDEPGRECVHRLIYEELCRGVAGPAARDALVGVIGALADAGADAVILGCTELTLAVGPGDSPLPLFDSTALHVAAAVDWMLDEETGR